MPSRESDTWNDAVSGKPIKGSSVNIIQTLVVSCFLCTGVSLILYPNPAIELSLVQFVQKNHWVDELMVSITEIGDAGSIITLFAPILLWNDFCYDNKLHRVGLICFMALMSADVLNAFLKWPFAGDRPYWTDSSVRQFGEHSCESGFGHPSGHCMGSAAFWISFAIVNPVYFVPFVSIFLFLVAISRVHIGAHFPSQVIAGLICGWVMSWTGRKLVSQLETRYMWRSFRFRIFHAAVFSFTILIFAFLEILVLNAFNFDAHRSINLAKSACELGESGVHLSTSPIVTITKWSGLVFGAATAIGVSYHIIGEKRHYISIYRRVMLFIIGILVVRYLSNLADRYDHLSGFLLYITIYLHYVALGIWIGIVPGIGRSVGVI